MLPVIKISNELEDVSLTTIYGCYTIAILSTAYISYHSLTGESAIQSPAVLPLIRSTQHD